MQETFFFSSRVFSTTETERIKKVNNNRNLIQANRTEHLSVTYSGFEQTVCARFLDGVCVGSDKFTVLFRASVSGLGFVHRLFIRLDSYPTLN